VTTTSPKGKERNVVNLNVENKIRPSHHQRKAIVYIRQSTLMQVRENTESTKQQYDLRERAVSLGWDPIQVQVIDEDLGLSATSSEKRHGFQKLVAQVSLAQVGAIFGLEVSRLARSCSDWHRLIELCALGDTLIIDQDGIYNPNLYNDRLVLGLKGIDFTQHPESPVNTGFLRGVGCQYPPPSVDIGSVRKSL
jgi:hypothetical protein